MTARWNRVVEVYSNTTDELVAEYDIDNMPLERIKDVFGDDLDDPECLHLHRIEP